MKFKSYYAPSVQAAIGLARQEFGDDVTLITSHATPPTTRNLGEYEVVFAIDEPEVEVAAPVAEVLPPPAPVAEKFHAFQEALLDAVKSPEKRNVTQQLTGIRASLIEVGLDSATVRALMTLIERSVNAGETTGTESLTKPEPLPMVVTVKAAAQTGSPSNQPRLSPAEMAFLASVSSPADKVRS